MAWFLKMDTVPGESMQHKGYMDVLHWQLGADMPVTAGGATGGLRKGESNMHDFMCTVQPDKSCNEMQKALLGGRHIPGICLEGYKSIGGEDKLYYKVTFKDALLSSLNYGTGSGNEMGPISFSVKYNEYEASHWEHDKKGTPGSPVIVKFNCGTHKVS